MYLVSPTLLGRETACPHAEVLYAARERCAWLAHRLEVPSPDVTWAREWPFRLSRAACSSGMNRWGQIDIAANRLTLEARTIAELDLSGLEFVVAHMLGHHNVPGPEWLLDLYACEELGCTDIAIVPGTAQAIAANPVFRAQVLKFAIGPRVLEIGDRLNADSWEDSYYQAPCAAPHDRRYPW